MKSVSCNIMQKTNNRIEVVDVLRAIAVVGIIMIHFLEHMNFYLFPAEPEGFWGEVGQWLWDAIFFIGAGKMYAIFSLLFGLSCFIQHDNQAQKGVDFRLRFAWRMVLLMAFAYLDLVFYNGDILSTYAICGLLLIPLIRLSDKALTAVMVFFLLQPIELVSMIVGLLNPEARAINLGTGPIFGKLFPVLAEGTFWQAAWVSMSNGVQLAVGWAIENGRFTQTLALFAAGMLLGRKRLFYNEGNNLKFWKSTLFISFAASAIFIIAMQFAPKGRDLFHSGLNTALSMWRNFAMMSFYVSGIVLLFYKKNCLRFLAPYGKMSLTHYLGQSVIGAVLFYGWGLGLYKYCNHTVSFFMSFALIAAQIVFSHYWAKRHKRGPLEQVWSTLTWLPYKNLK